MEPLRRVLRFVRPYRRLALLSLLLLSFMVCLDLALPRLIQRIIDQGIAGHDRAVVIGTSLAMLGISALSTLLAIGNNAYSVQVGEGVARDLRDALFVKIQSFSFGNLDGQKTGQLMVRLTSDVNAIKGLVQISLRIGTRAPLMMVGSALLMISTSRELALTMLPLLFGTSVLIVLFVLRMEPLYRLVQTKLDALNNVLQENIAGVRVVKALVRADFEQQRFAVANDEMTRRSIDVMKFMSSMGPVLTLCVNLGLLIVIWSGGHQAIAGRLSLGQLVAFSNYMLSTMTPLVMMTLLSTIWAVRCSMPSASATPGTAATVSIRSAVALMRPPTWAGMFGRAEGSSPLTRILSVAGPLSRGICTGNGLDAAAPLPRNCGRTSSGTRPDACRVAVPQCASNCSISAAPSATRARRATFEKPV